MHSEVRGSTNFPEKRYKQNRGREMSWVVSRACKLPLRTKVRSQGWARSTCESRLAANGQTPLSAPAAGTYLSVTDYCSGNRDLQRQESAFAFDLVPRPRSMMVLRHSSALTSHIIYHIETTP